MTMPRVAEASRSLANVAVFADLSPDCLARIERRCAWRRYGAGEPIVDYLDASRDVFFIASGEARVSIYSLLGKDVIFCDLRPGDMFGELAAIDGAPRSAGIEARSDCLVASLSAGAFREVLQSEPKVTLALLGQLVAKVRGLTTRVYEFSALAVANRIQAEVLRMANLAPRYGKSARIAAPPTHAEIAGRVSTHREAVTRELNRLSRVGVIERRDGALIVKDVERLTEMVQDATGE